MKNSIKLVSFGILALTISTTYGSELNLKKNSRNYNGTMRWHGP